MSASDITAAEYRALGRLMRHARAEGYTYRISSAFGRSDWSWSKDHKYAVVAEPLPQGWKVHADDHQFCLFPKSVQQLTDVLAALGLLPSEVQKLREKLDKPCGECHPCTNWAPQTWINAGRSIPPVHRYDAMVAELELRRAKAGAA